MRLSFFRITSILALCFLFTSFTNKEKVSVVDYYNYHIPLSNLVHQPVNKSGFQVLIQKSSYTLFLKYNGRLVKSYPVVFGADPIGDKRMKGDKRTPEGRFRINGVRNHDLWAYFISLDYPNHESWTKHEKAKYYYEIPQTANIGGAIGIHGVADGLESWIDSKSNWTDGCIAMKNRDIKELARNIGSGTEVLIFY